MVAQFQYLYTSENALAVNKPAGLLSVPGRLPQNKDCLETRVRLHYDDALSVHRLDQVTSGIVLYARNKVVQRFWNRQFEQRRVHKTYIAVVQGLVDKEAGSVRLPLRCDWENRPLQIVDAIQGKSALTHWRVLHRDRAANCTRMELVPITGRSHQLRVHMQQLGHPIIGDEMYGAQPAPRVLLHAAAISIAHPAQAMELLRLKKNRWVVPVDSLPLQRTEARHERSTLMSPNHLGVGCGRAMLRLFCPPDF